MKKRDMNIEWIRVLSCIFVILIHVSNHYRRHMSAISLTSYLFSVAVNVVTRVAVPFFFMISGALLLGREEEHGFKRVIATMKPLALWTVIYGFWEVYFKGTKLDVVNILYEPVTKHLWYMYVMIGIYIALPYLQVLFKHLSEQLQKRFLVIWFLMLTFTFISKFFGYTPKYDIPIVGNTIYYSGYFVLGYYIYNHKDEFSRNRSLILGIASLLLLFVWTLNAGKNVERVLQYRNFLMVMASCGLFHYLLGIKNIPIKDRLIHKISFCSLGIYYVHIIFLDIFKQLDFLFIHSLIGIPLLTIVIFMLSYAAIKLLHCLHIKT